MGGLLGHWANVGQALWRLLKAVRSPAVIPKRIDQLVFALAGGHYSFTISRWALEHADKLYARLIFWITEPFDRRHVWEVSDTRPYHRGPGFGWALLGNSLVMVAVIVVWRAF